MYEMGLIDNDVDASNYEDSDSDNYDNGCGDDGYTNPFLEYLEFATSYN